MVLIQKRKLEHTGSGLWPSGVHQFLTLCLLPDFCDSMSMAQEPETSQAKPKRPSSTGASKKTNRTSSPVVTIFGGSGFIGRSLINRLTSSGARVVVAARHSKTHDRTTVKGSVETVKYVGASILSDSDVRLATEEAQVVINLVGILYESGDQTFEAVHAEGARRVAQASRDAGVDRLIHMSALGADANSTSAYSRTKAKGEQHVHDIFPEATILRPSIVFGPEDDFFNRFAEMAKYSPALPLVGGGHTRFQPVYVEDVTGAICKFMTDETTKGQIYEFGGPKVYTFKDLLKLLLDQKKTMRALIPIPYFLAEIQGSVLQMLPKPPITRDQVESLKRDNVLTGACPGLSELGIEPTPVEDVLPTYL